MKKNLLGSTAIIGASLLMPAPVAAQGPDLSISGHVKFEMWFDAVTGGLRPQPESDRLMITVGLVTLLYERKR